MKLVSNDPPLISRRQNSLMRSSEAQRPGGLAPLTKPFSAILKKLREAAEVDGEWLLTLAR